MGGSAGFVLAGTWLLILAWGAAAIPTSLIARRLGHPMWIAYVAWCPLWPPFLFQILPFHVRWLSGFVGYLESCTYGFSR